MADPLFTAADIDRIRAANPDLFADSTPRTAIAHLPADLAALLPPTVRGRNAIPARVYAADTPAHVDTDRVSPSTPATPAHIVYLTPSPGELFIGDEETHSLDTPGLLFTIPAGVPHGTRGTGTTTRISIGPFNEAGHPVGAVSTAGFTYYDANRIDFLQFDSYTLDTPYTVRSFTDVSGNLPAGQRFLGWTTSGTGTEVEYTTADTAVLTTGQQNIVFYPVLVTPPSSTPQTTQPSNAILSTANAMVNSSANTSSVAGLAIVQARRSTPTMRFPDYSSYLRYQQGIARAQIRRAAAPQVTAAPVSVPAPPTIVSAISQGGSYNDGLVVVTFNPPTNTGGSPIRYYTAHAYTSALGDVIYDTQVSTANTVFIPVAPLTVDSNVSYTFRVSATNAVGTSAWSAESGPVAILGTPTAPLNVTTTPAIGQVTIGFGTPEHTGGSPIQYYVVKTFREDATPVSPDVSGTFSPIEVTDLTTGDIYSFTVYAVNANGGGLQVDTGPITVGVPPSIPTNLSVIPGDSQIIIYFTESTPDITDYEYTTDGGDNWISTGSTTSPITITGLTNATEYTIQLRAVNIVGASDGSDSVTVAPIPATSPPIEETPRLWLDAMIPASVLLSSGKVTGWNDSSTTGNDFITGDSASAVILYAQPSGINSRPALNFITSSANSGPWTYMNRGVPFNLSPSNALTLFMIVRQTAEPTDFNSELFFTQTNYAYFDLYSNTNSPGNGQLNINMGSGTSANTTDDIVTAPPRTVILSTVLTNSPGNGVGSVYVNGNPNPVNNTARGSLSLNLPNLNWMISGGGFTGNMGEIIAYDAALSTGDRQAVEGYLAWKWGLQGNLNSSHPYRNSPPRPIPSGTVYTSPTGTGNISTPSTSPFGGGGNSYSFNGVNSYLSVDADDSWAFGTDDFTVEWFQYQTDSNPFPRIFTVGTYQQTGGNISVACTIEGGSFLAWTNNYSYFGTDATPYKGQWVHFAIVRRSGQLRVYKDGVLFAGPLENTADISNNTTTLFFGTETVGDIDTAFGGYLTNIRIVKGLAVYTGNFTVPTSALTLAAGENPYGGSNTQAIPAGFTKLLFVP
jgi:hypothetical protein